VTEREKMLAGKICDPADKEIMAPRRALAADAASVVDFAA
jgi:hypothetical protein